MNPVRPIFYFDVKKSEWIRSSSTKDCPEGVLMTRQFLNWLRNKFDFQVEKIEKVYFYKKCSIIPEIYKSLTLARAEPGISEGKKKLLKQTVNFSCGYFGYNANKNKTFYTRKLVLDMPQTFDMTKGHVVEMLYNTNLPAIGADRVQDDLVFLLSIPKKKFAQKVSAVPIPLFVNIVESGKFRMSQFLSFLDTHVKSNDFRHCYTHIDNCILVFSKDDAMDCVPDRLKTSFQRNAAEFFNDEKPGGFKFEKGFSSTQDWKFVTHRMQNHVLMCDKKGTVKSAAFKDLNTFDAFDYSVKILKKQKVSLQVTRRVNKLQGLDTHVQTVSFLPKMFAK
jgi:hypothetical protein